MNIEYTKDKGETARILRDVLWEDYCNFDPEKEEEMENEIGWNRYDAISDYPFSVVRMLLEIIQNKNAELEHKETEMKTYRAVLGAINVRTSEVLSERGN